MRVRSLHVAFQSAPLSSSLLSSHAPSTPSLSSVRCSQAPSPTSRCHCTVARIRRPGVSLGPADAVYLLMGLGIAFLSGGPPSAKQVC